MSKQPTPAEILADIRAYCLDCMGGSRKAVQHCTSRECRLWRHRAENTGEKPKRNKGQVTMFDLIRKAT